MREGGVGIVELTSTLGQQPHTVKSTIYRLRQAGYLVVINKDWYSCHGFNSATAKEPKKRGVVIVPPRATLTTRVGKAISSFFFKIKTN